MHREEGEINRDSWRDRGMDGEEEGGRRDRSGMPGEIEKGRRDKHGCLGRQREEGRIGRDGWLGRQKEEGERMLKGAVSRYFLAFFYFMNKNHLGP